MNAKNPIGKFTFDPDVTTEKRQRWIEDVAALPTIFRKTVADLQDEQLNTPYHNGDMTVRQIVHHMADSQLLRLVFFRMALTEDGPVTTGYDHAKWAELMDAKLGPVDVSLNLLDAIHARWVILMQSMTPADFARSFREPDGQVVTLDRALQFNAWHGKHHTAQITKLRDRKGWNKPQEDIVIGINQKNGD